MRIIVGMGLVSQNDRNSIDIRYGLWCMLPVNESGSLGHTNRIVWLSDSITLLLAFTPIFFCSKSSMCYSADRRQK